MELPTKISELTKPKLIRLVFILVLFFETLSYTSFFYPSINFIVFWVIVFFAFILSLKDLRYGIYFVLAELAIGSQGYLFSFNWHNFAFSIRLGLFLAVILAFIIYLVRKRDLTIFKSPGLISYYVLLIFLGGGVVSGLIHHHPLKDIFLDANGYLFYGLLPIFLIATASQEKLKQCLSVVIGAFLALTAKTVILLFFFSHHVSWLVPSLYRWSREMKIAEIAEIGSGVFRIFFQSHIWALLVFFLILAIVFSLAKKNQFSFTNNRSLIFLIFLSSLVIFISYSRSFWLAAGCGISLMLLLLLITKTNLKIISRLVVFIIINFLLVIGSTYAIVNFPWPKSDAIALGSLIEERSKDLSEESASVSRFQLLSPLLAQVKTEFLLGSGFGTKVTYLTQDPRYIEMQGTNKYSTYVFEWAYLDTITEIGLLGLVVYFLFLSQIFTRGLKMIKRSKSPFEQSIIRGLLVSLFVLMLVHVFTPYLNHPLGIGIIMLTYAAILVLTKPEQTQAST